MYDIVPKGLGPDPLEQLLAAERRAEYRWDIGLEADFPTQTREQFVRNNAHRRAQHTLEKHHD
jgi:hypothetical protein